VEVVTLHLWMVCSAGSGGYHRSFQSQEITYQWRYGSIRTDDDRSGANKFEV